MRSYLLRVAAAAIALAASTPCLAAWHEAKSKHFIIYADLKPQELRNFADRLERFDQAVRHFQSMDDPQLTDANRLTIYVMPSVGSVAKLARAGSGVAGLYTSHASGSFAFVPRIAGSQSDQFDLDTEAIFFHEYAHHLQLKFSSAALPVWVSEGFAEFFATARVMHDGSVAIGAPPMYRAYSLVILDDLSIEELMSGTAERLTDTEIELIYGRGWLLTHYLAFEPARTGQLRRYIDGIQAGQGAVESAKSAFGDLRQLAVEMERYLRRRTLRSMLIKAETLSSGPITIRQLGAGEATMTPIRLRSKRGVSKKIAPGIAAEARQAAASYPNDPFVQGTLAEAEHDAGDYAAADAAADRALAADPNNVQALIYKGRIQMDMAKADPGKADWPAIRNWFLKANKLDTENAEPLMLFYETYARAGTKPTKNAVDALLYAVALAPQDTNLRLLAVRQLLIDDRVKEARILFAPLAFRPHSSKVWRESTAKIMEAIVAGDGKAALALMDDASKRNEAEASKS